MLQGEHSAILSTCIKLPHGFKTFVSSIFEWPLKTGFTVYAPVNVIIILITFGSDATKPVFEVSDKTRLKPVSSATETSLKIEILLVASLDMILSNTQITKALIRLCGYAGKSAPLLFANPEDRFSQVEAYI